jgi:hypothetical protein
VSSRQQKRHPAASKTAPPESPPAFLLPLLERRSAILACLLVLIASARIASTYTVFNHTADEPAHIASGMQWSQMVVWGTPARHTPSIEISGSRQA